MTNKLERLVQAGLLSAALITFAPIPGVVAQNYNSNSTALNVNTVNWNSEDTYWRNKFATRPYYNGAINYSSYQPAYKFGVNSYSQFGGMNYEDLDQAQLRRDWENIRGNSNLSWEQAQPAFRDSYSRLYNNRNTALGRSLNDISPAAGGNRY